MQKVINSLAYLLLLASVTASANCPANKRAACDFAKKMAADLSPRLPIQLSRNMQLSKAFAQDQQLNLYVMLNYDRSFLASAMRQKGASVEDAKKGLAAFAQNYVCSTPLLAQATKLGFIQSFHYQLVNGELLTSFSVSRCN
jgi:hypothetical protein